MECVAVIYRKDRLVREQEPFASFQCCAVSLYSTVLAHKTLHTCAAFESSGSLEKIPNVNMTQGVLAHGNRAHVHFVRDTRWQHTGNLSRWYRQYLGERSARRLLTVRPVVCTKRQSINFPLASWTRVSWVNSIVLLGSFQLEWFQLEDYAKRTVTCSCYVKSEKYSVIVQQLVHQRMPTDS